jgi:diadenosine tetraphosphate (Ap4A) HIT family hydrolase
VPGCLFCERIAAAPGSGDSVAFAFPDRFPVSDGHMLVVPRRHIERLETLPAVEWTGLFALVHQICQEVAAQPGVDGVNVGVNSGEAAGQTVAHAHVHVIPRRLGDVADPRGGVRHLIPGKAEYWSRP